MNMVLPTVEKPKPTMKLSLPALHPAQYEVVNACELFPGTRFVVAACGSKFGKAIRINELIPTTTGWKIMGELKEGDFVFDENGNPTKVTYVTDTMYGHKCYEVIFSDGTSVVADAEHSWVTWSKAYRKAYDELKRAASPRRQYRIRKSTKQECEVLTTEEIRETLFIRHDDKLVPNHSIPLVSSPLSYPKQDLPIDPYVLGAWLGDGTSCRGEITGVDEEILVIVGKIYPRHQTDYNKSRTQLWSFKGLLEDLKALGLANNKHVPASYLIGSAEQRLALLQGLMDTDGTISKRGDCTFDNTNKELADSVDELAVSLGIKVNRQERFGKLNGVSKKLCYRVHFTTDLPVFCLKRKLDRIRSVAAKAKRRYITEVRSIQSAPVRCITVDNPSHLFLVGKGCIPTHNSFGLSAKIVQEAWVSGPGDWFFWVAPTYAQTNIAKDLIKLLLPPKTFEESKKEMRITLVGPRGEERSSIFFKSADDEDNLRGYGTKMFILDEASRCSQASFESLVTNTSRTRGKGIIISTPKGRGWFYDAYRRGDKSLLAEGEPDPYPEWRSFQCSAEMNPYVTKQTIEELKRLFSEQMFRQEVLAEFLSDKDGVFGDVHSCIYGELEEPKKGRTYIIGCDLAQLHDYTVVVVLDLETKHVVAFYRFNKMTWRGIYDQIAAAARMYNNAKVVIDATTYGAAPVEALAEIYRLDVLPFKISSNELKQEIIEKLKISIERREITFPNIPILIQEMLDYEYKIGARGVTIYGSPRGKFDDSVIALALANWYCTQPRYVYRYSNVRGI